MRWIGAAVVVAAVLVSGCGNGAASGRADAGSPVTTPPPGQADVVATDGIYEAGVDIVPGVYTTSAGSNCVGYTASSADFSLEDSEGPDAFLSGAEHVGGVERIVVHRGEFFTSRYCDKWQRETAGEPESPDPANLAGGCEILVGGDDLVRQVVTFLRKPRAAQDSALAAQLQQRLMAPVDAQNRRLGDPAGQLVDALDDPPVYVDARGALADDVTRAVAKIRNACA